MKAVFDEEEDRPEQYDRVCWKDHTSNAEILQRQPQSGVLKTVRRRQKEWKRSLKQWTAADVQKECMKESWRRKATRQT